MNYEQRYFLRKCNCVICDAEYVTRSDKSKYCNACKKINNALYKKKQYHREHPNAKYRKQER